MKRPPKDSPPVFTGNGIRLKKDTRAELIDLLGIDELDAMAVQRASLAIIDIEFWLSMYPGMVSALDEAPRPAHYRDAIKRTRALCVELSQILVELNGRAADMLNLHGANCENAKSAIASITQAANRALDALSTLESRAAPRKTARQQLVNELRAIFRTFYQGEPYEPPLTGGIANSLSARDADETEFIKAILLAAGIESPENIRRLFDDGPLPEMG